ncbi:hypothetical protein BH09ACT1_BH09ACT1_26260 [soil metagenome]
MFEDDVTVPAGWYPDPMGLPQLRWWNSHAWTELTTEAVSPIRPAKADDDDAADGVDESSGVIERLASTPASSPAVTPAASPATTPVTPVIPQLGSSLRSAAEQASDDALSRREQRAQRERDEQFGTLAASQLEESFLVQSTDTIEHVRAIDVEPYPEDDEDDQDDQNEDEATPAPGRSEPSTLTGPIFTGSIFTIADVPRASQPAIGPAIAANQSTDAGRPARTESPFEPRAAIGAVSGSVAQNDRPTLPITPGEPAAPVVETTTRPALPPVYTGPVWIIAVMPAIHLIIGLLLLLGFGARFGITPTIVILSVLYVVDVGLALLDRRDLSRLGYTHRASWAWALLTGPVYLVARALALVRVGRPGLAPLGVWVLIAVLQLGSILVVPGLLISALPEAFSAQAEKSVTADASIIGTRLEVDCPPSPPALIGSTFTCEATTASGDTSDVVVRLLRVNGWIDWHVDDWGSLGLSR